MNQGRVTLADPGLQEDLEQFGFAVVPFLDAAELEAVRAAHERIGPAPDDPRMSTTWTFHSRSRDHKVAVKEQMRPLVDRAVRTHFVDHRVYLTTFITKWPGPHSAFAPHQDPSLVDERHFRGVTVWIPLNDTGQVDGRDNGMLHVVPGSHLFSDDLRVQDVDDFAYADHEDPILASFGRGVPTRAGEALVFDNRVIHYSLPNETDEPRVVLSLGVRPSESRCTVVRHDGAGNLAVYAVHDDFYIDVLPATQHLWEPTDPPVATVQRTAGRMAAQEFANRCRAVGAAPRTVPGRRPRPGDHVDPGAFCALCGSAEGLSEHDRAGRNNAQLVCPTCRDAVRSGAAPPS